MKIAIIGAGFTGLSAALELSKNGHDVSVFEKNSEPGGLAIGYKDKNWEWALEEHYHHWFTNDYAILNLAKEINHEVIIKRPQTSVYIKNTILQLDSPLTVLKFPLLNFLDKIRMSFVLIFLKINPFWKLLEGYRSSKVLPRLMGKRAYELIWEPLFVNKFGTFANNISLAWFWARIKKRTPSLAYPKGGFLLFAQNLTKRITTEGGKFYFETEILQIINEDMPTIIWKDKNGNSKKNTFDKIIVTLPSAVFLKIIPQVNKEYKKTLGSLKSIGATNLLLRLKKPFFKNNTYWLSICDKNAPVMAIVEHTNFINKKFYNNECILYLGNYMSQENPYFSMTKKEMLREFDPYLRTINPEYYKSLIDVELFKAPFAQPIIPINYSKQIPPFETPLDNVFLANIEQVYPWDRGTNYAVILGQKIAKIINTKTS